MKTTPAVMFVAALFSLLLLTWLLLSGLNLDATRFDRELSALDDYARFERALNREVLTARAGLSRDYDALVRLEKTFDDSLKRLREAAGTDSDVGAAIQVLAARAAREKELVEQFKSDNAQLQNSLAYFGMFDARLSAPDQDRYLAAAATGLAAAMLHLMLDTSQGMSREVRNRLDELAMFEGTSGERESIRALLAHGGKLLDLVPATGTVVKALLDTASLREQDVVRSLILKRQLASRASAGRYRLLLYATSLLLLVVLVHLGLRLRTRTVSLQRRAALEHVIASVSTRFVNSNNDEIATDVERALGELSETFGADRAYFMLAAESVQIHQWSRDGVEFPLGWPGRALGLARRLAQGHDDPIHVESVGRYRLDSASSALIVADLNGWLCIPSPKGASADAILGFDAVRSSRLSQWTDHGLLRMAFDAIANAVSRAKIAEERDRFEKRLQQARRMETIGVFSSGIAHNFNNIVGAILGHAEVAIAHVESGSRPASNLTEILRASERARALIGQILTFGSRRDFRRDCICVEALVEETRSLLAASLPSRVGLVVHQTSEETIVLAEPAQLQQVILNVCNNAAQAMDKPGVIEIEIAVQETTRTLPIGDTEIAPGRFATISVTDSGRGMDEATLERAFEPFFTTRVNGNGLGLATVREIVQEHGGAVKVKSVPGKGTRFDIWLPSIASSSPLSMHGATEVMGCGLGQTVLVFEADRARLLRHEDTLAALGYEPVGFGTPGEAVAACRVERARFDAALVCHQPGTTSDLDFASALHDVAPTLPIILATPLTRSLGSQLLAGSGISERVRHPLTSAELAAALSRCMAAPQFHNCVHKGGFTSRPVVASPQGYNGNTNIPR
jgi:signal transduction histidine kinase